MHESKILKDIEDLQISLDEVRAKIGLKISIAKKKISDSGDVMSNGENYKIS